MSTHIVSAQAPREPTQYYHRDSKRTDCCGWPNRWTYDRAEATRMTEADAMAHVDGLISRSRQGFAIDMSRYAVEIA